MVTSLPNSVGFTCFPFRIASVCGSNTLSTLSTTCVSPPRTRALVCSTRVDNRPKFAQTTLNPLQPPLDRRGRRPHTLADATHHCGRVPHHAIGDAHQAAITADQCGLSEANASFLMEKPHESEPIIIRSACPKVVSRRANFRQKTAHTEN